MTISMNRALASQHGRDHSVETPDMNETSPRRPLLDIAASCSVMIMKLYRGCSDRV